MSTDILEEFEILAKIIESIRADITKNAAGNKSAGVRSRKALREVKKKASVLVKLSLENDKS